MAVTLALDTSTPFLTLALTWQTTAAAAGELERSSEVGRAHAELLPEAVRGLLAEAGLPFFADQIVIGTGPGSYTGVRVGASYALGLGRVWGAPVLGVGTLESLVRDSGQQAVSLDARKGHRYAAIYDVQDGVVTNTVQPPEKVEAEAFANTVVNLPHRQDEAPSGLALLRAGLRHGRRDWELSYL